MLSNMVQLSVGRAMNTTIWRNDLIDLQVHKIKTGRHRRTMIEAVRNNIITTDSIEDMILGFREAGT